MCVCVCGVTEREREREAFVCCWFIPHMHAMVCIGLGQSQEQDTQSTAPLWWPDCCSLYSLPPGVCSDRKLALGEGSWTLLLWDAGVSSTVSAVRLTAGLLILYFYI